MRKLTAILFMAGGLAAIGATPDFECSNSKYRLEISDASETAKVTHLKRSGTKFTTLKFKRTGEKVPRYRIDGEAKALRYEGSPSEQWYDGQAVISTSAKLDGDDVVYSAKFMIDYDPYYTVAVWDHCSVK